MTVGPRYYAALALVAVSLLLAVCSLQYVLHVGTCGNGPNSVAFGAPPCPGGITWRILGGVVALLIAVLVAARLGRPATSLAFGLGFTMIGAMFAILGFIPAPGEDPTALGLAVGAPFFLGGLVGFALTARAYRRG